MSKSTYTARSFLAALVVLIAGCGATTPAAATPRPTVSASATPAPPPTATPVPMPTACGPGAVAFWLTAPDGSKLEANSVGSGPDAAVFLHEAGRPGMCGFWQYAQWLAGHEHVRAILVNRCGYGASRCPSPPAGDAGIVSQTKPAVDWARAQGATRVTLVGASWGGGDALQAAGVIPGVDGVVDLSGDGNDTSANDVADAKRLRVPALFAVAPDDPLCPVASLQSLYDQVPAHVKRFVVVSSRPGAHGWELLFNGAAVEPLGQTVAGWITAPSASG